MKLHREKYSGDFIPNNLTELFQGCEKLETFTWARSCVGLGTEFRSEKIPRNRLGMVSVIPRKKVLIPRYSEFRGRANS